MIVVTWHLVRPSPSDWLPGLKAMTPEALEGQLRHLAAHHEMIAPQRLLDGLARGERLPANSCVLTFDDGSAGQHDHVLPILERLGLRAFFFVPTSIVEDGRVPVVEKQRVLQYGSDAYAAFYDRFCDRLSTLCPEVPAHVYLPTAERIDDARDYYAEYDFYGPLERLFRKVREQVLTDLQFSRVIDAMFAEAYDEREFAGRYFLTWDALRAMRHAGMEIGGHGHLHFTDTAVSSDEAAADARRCLSLLEQRLAMTVRSYAYPYGIYVPATVNVLRAHPIDAAFTCRAGLDWIDSPLTIDRLDCSMFPTQANAEPCAWSVAEKRAAEHAQPS